MKKFSSVLLISCLCAVLAGCAQIAIEQVDITKAPRTTTTDNYDYIPVSDRDTLVNIIQQAATICEDELRAYGIDGDSTMLETEDAADNAAPPSVGKDYATTNLQVEGVDEADIIKTDGQYIYRVNADNTEVVVIRADSDGSLTLTDRVTLPKIPAQAKADDSCRYICELYLDDNYLTVLYTSYINYDHDSGYTGRNIQIPLCANREGCGVAVYELNNGRATLHRTAEVEGCYLDSRKIDDCIYLITNKYFYYPDLIELRSDELLNHAIPYIYDSEQSADYTSLSLDSIYYCPGNPDTLDDGTLTVTALNIASDEPLSTVSYLGGGDTIYMDNNTLYIANPYWGSGDNQDKTILHSFDVTGLTITEQATGEIPGTLLNQFSMDEYDGYFRVAVTEEQEINGQWSTDNSIYILNPDLQITGSLTGLAPGEQIYAVRFMGELGYVVTFVYHDPLFVLDLSDPTAPQVTGELKIPGYSDYLEPYGDSALLGFGKDSVTYQTDWSDEPFALYQALKISVLDISDTKNPLERDVFTIGDRGTESSVLYDHKSLLFDKSSGLMAIPITVYEHPDGVAVTPEDYGELATQGCYIFKVTSNSIELLAAVSHLSQEEIDYGVGDKHYVDRALYIGDVFFVCSPSRLTSHSINHWTQLDTLDF